MLQTLGRYALNWLKWLDAGGNVATGGAWNESISERAAKARNAGRRWGCVLCALLDSAFPGHCDDTLTSEDATIPDGE